MQLYFLHEGHIFESETVIFAADHEIPLGRLEWLVSLRLLGIGILYRMYTQCIYARY